MSLKKSNIVSFRKESLIKASIPNNSSHLLVNGRHHILFHTGPITLLLKISILNLLRIYLYTIPKTHLHQTEVSFIINYFLIPKIFSTISWVP